MNHFTQLFFSHPELSPGERQRAVERELPSQVDQSLLHWWSPEPPPVHRRLLIGFASYSRYDMRLLDLICGALEVSAQARHHVAPAIPLGGFGLVRLPPQPARVGVFSVLDCKSQSDFDKYIPGIGSVLQTPVVGLWVDGVLQKRATGAAGRALIADELNFDPVQAMQ